MAIVQIAFMQISETEMTTGGYVAKVDMADIIVRKTEMGVFIIQG